MDKFSSKHLIFIVLGLSVVSLKTYPTILVKTSGTDTWICMIIASIFIFLFTYYIFKTCGSKNCFSIKEIYFSSVGKYIGSFFLIMLILTFYLTLIESCSVESNSLHTNLLYSTPTWFFILFLVIPCLYSVRKGKNAILIITVIGIILIMIAGINLGILSSKYKYYKNLFPVLVNGFTSNMLLSIIKMLGLYSFIFAIIPYAKNVDDKRKLTKYILIGLFLVVQMEIISSIGIIATFGADRASVISYPKLIQTQEISYWGFLESGEFFVMLQIVGGWYIKYILVFYSMLQILNEIKLVNKYTPFIITFLVAIPSFYTSKNIFKLFYLLNYFSYICFSNLIIIPIIIFTLYNIKYRKEA